MRCRPAAVLLTTSGCSSSPVQAHLTAARPSQQSRAGISMRTLSESTRKTRSWRQTRTDALCSCQASLMGEGGAGANRASTSARALSRRAHRTRLWRSSSCSFACCMLRPASLPPTTPLCCSWPAAAARSGALGAASAASRSLICFCSSFSSPRRACVACRLCSPASACRRGWSAARAPSLQHSSGPLRRRSAESLSLQPLKRLAAVLQEG